MAAYAAECDELVIDYTKVANRKIDVEKVTKAARELAGQGATVRVRVYDTLRGSPNVEEFGTKIAKGCHWMNANGVFLSNLIFIPFAVEKGDIDVARGPAIRNRITDNYATDATRIYMTPKWQSYKRDPNALTDGLVHMLDDFKRTLAKASAAPPPSSQRPVPSQAPVVIHKSSSDGSWVWKAFMVIGGIIVIVGGAFVFLRHRQDAGEASAAQAEASRVRSSCVDRLIKLTDEQESTIRKARADDVKRNLTKSEMHEIDSALAESERLGKQGIAAFSRFDSFDKDDPNRRGLSVAAYRSNQARYEEIIVEYVEPAEALIADIEKKLEAAEKEADAA